MRLCLPMKARSGAHSQLSRRGAVPAEVAVGFREPLLAPAFPKPFPRMETSAGHGWRPASAPAPRGSVLGKCKHILKI